MSVASVLPEPGQVVEVRGSTWAVANVQPQGLPRSPADEAIADLSHVVDLQSLDEDRLGEQLSVVWELEVGKTVTPAQGLPERIHPQGFDDPVTLAGFVDAMRWGAVTSADPNRYQAPFWSGVVVEAYQLEPLRRALASPRTNLLLADDAQRCPWCGTPITAAQVKADATLRRVFVYCGDELARCPFAKGGIVAEGLPILTVDEEIYRLTPAFVIATVDKFARLAREGEAAALFGYVGLRCARHGYVHPDYAACNISTAHPATDGQPAATVRPVGRLRPPDLIIQDELHLITGALGTSVGLFEVAVETLASWERSDGTPVRPVIVASTATVRNAQEQVRGLYGRQVEMFPPQVFDVADTFFSQEMGMGAGRPLAGG